MITTHWGVPVNSGIPVTGVVNSSSPEWLHEDAFKGIDIDFEEHEKECENEEHDGCYQNDEPTYLIGFRKNAEGKYEPDPQAEYSAIVGVPYAQIVKSKYVSRVRLCSPCFPGQGDLDTPGEFLAYTLPHDVWSDGEHLPILAVEDLTLFSLTPLGVMYHSKLIRITTESGNIVSTGSTTDSAMLISGKMRTRPEED